MRYNRNYSAFSAGCFQHSVTWRGPSDEHLTLSPVVARVQRQSVECQPIGPPRPELPSGVPFFGFVTNSNFTESCPFDSIKVSEGDVSSKRANRLKGGQSIRTVPFFAQICSVTQLYLWRHSGVMPFNCQLQRWFWIRECRVDQRTWELLLFDTSRVAVDRTLYAGVLGWGSWLWDVKAGAGDLKEAPLPACPSPSLCRG